MFLDLAMTKTWLIIKDDDFLINYLLSDKGEKSLNHIRNPLIFDKLEEYLIRFYVPVFPEKTEKVIAKIKLIRDLNFGPRATLNSAPLTNTVKEKVSKKGNALQGSGTVDSCGDLLKKLLK